MDKKFLVFGAGISGIGSASLLMNNDENVVLYDGNINIDKNKLRGKLPKNKNVDIVLGSMTDDILKDIDIAVLSPGVPTDCDDVIKMKEKNILIWGEIELAYRFEKGKILAITGTNGKTTTTSLLGEIMKNYKKDVFVAGNIGTAYTDTAPLTKNDSVTVLEISSFQLDTTIKFHPNVSCILNITPDHLDRHHTFQNYANVKKSIAKNQTKDETCVLNYEDENTRKIGEQLSINVLYFSSKRELEKGFYLKDDSIIYSDGTKKETVVLTHELALLGIHNYENVMAACAMAISANVPMDIIRKTVKEFKAVEHRIEFVAVKNGVYYYNDSKGTNPDAAIKGIRAMNRPTCLIGGGYDKDSSYDEWIKAFDNKVKVLVLIGVTREKIALAARNQGFNNIIMADTFEEAFNICTQNASDGDAVLLSPACASWGMFKNYEERGRIFKELVNKL